MRPGPRRVTSMREKTTESGAVLVLPELGSARRTPGASQQQPEAQHRGAGERSDAAGKQA